MSETCIVCLGDLDADSGKPPRLASRIGSVSSDDKDGVRTGSPEASPSQDESSEHIAHLLPCGHNMHNECLKPWVERANSCPICRQNFNLVELSSKVGDRTQVAEIDPSMIIDDDDFEEPDSVPCQMCGEDDNEDVLLLCDGCESACHTYCADLDSVPVGHWYCPSCQSQRALDPYPRPERARRQIHHSSDRRTRGQQRRLRSQTQANSSGWARVWQSVWDSLNFDLDFPFDDSDLIRSQRRIDNEQREFREWQRRFQVAERQGGANRFRDTASALLELRAPRERPAPPEPESQDEIRAWNAFEKAKEIEKTGPDKRKRRSTTSSPREPVSAQPERKLKRPRTRRAADLAESSSDSAAGPSGSRQASAGSSRGRRPLPDGNGGGPSFLQSLLKEVESSAAPDESSSAFRTKPMSNLNGDHSSPGMTSPPGGSPATSNYASPRALSATPPPGARSHSPSGLTSKVEPMYPAVDFSPSYLPPSKDLPSRKEQDFQESLNRGRQGRPQAAPSPNSSPPRSAEASPSRASISLSAKENVQKMVSAALKPHYQKQEISKDQFTDINRSISRMLYDKIGDLSVLDQKAKTGWEKVASDEVGKAVQGLRASGLTISTETAPVSI
ncbi:MAG: hypothetical protein M1819_000850 [Sarea resinae]|nr:MAG: hypothetical protein M1819_000850 [Sarea resinae]